MFFTYRIFFHGRRTGFVDRVGCIPEGPPLRSYESVWCVPGTHPDDPQAHSIADDLLRRIDAASFIDGTIHDALIAAKRYVATLAL